MPVNLPNLGSGRTTCTVLIHRHNRINPVDGTNLGNESDVLDISSYVNKVSISTNIYGGGAANLSLIPAFPWEDEIAANDLINIYLNTNRGDERTVYRPDDRTPLYNRGNVRVFFGYVDHVSKSVSVGGVGTRVTNYSLTVSSFEKAIKATTIYSNPNLSYQTDSAEDIVRPDISNNLGGIILMQKGFPIAGSPRHLILAHLFRTLGFGGQWLLPSSYVENLAKYDPQGEGNLDQKEGSIGEGDFSPWFLEWKKKKKEGASKGDFPYFWSPTLNQVPGKSKDPICFNTSFRYFPKSDEELGKRSDALQDFIQALEIVGTQSTSMAKSILNVGAVKDYLLEYINTLGLDTNKANAFQTYATNLDQSLIAEGMGWYWITNGTGASYGEYEKDFLKMLGTVGALKRRNNRPTRNIKLKYTKDFWKNFLEKQSPTATPAVNLTTNSNAPPSQYGPARTLFNILCLDYMEDVDGNYVMSEMYNFGGPLYSQLQRQSNDLIAELFFDLRIAPDFRVRQKDGLGVNLDGAIPVVPSVIHREKPFTNYEVPPRGADLKDSSPQSVSKDTANRRDPKLKVGRFVPAGSNLTEREDVDIASFTDDQYFLEVGGLQSYRSLVGDSATYKRIKGLLEPLGITEFPSDTVEKGTTKGRGSPEYTAIGDKVKKEKIKVAAADGEAVGVFQYKAKIGGKIYPLATKPYGLKFSLPRPVFRSPDNHRITEELKISSMNAILGYLKKNNTEVEFVAFGTNQKTSASIKNPGGPSYFNGDVKYKTVKEGHKYVLTTPLSGITKSSTGEVKPTERPTTWHVLEYMTIRDEDVMSESYSRGDFQISNIRELNINIMPDFEVQRATVADILPIVTPVSVLRNGIRVAPNNATSFIQYLIVGGATDKSWHQALGLRWAIMLDMWEQHNHEYLAGSLTLRGMPGLRVGYRIDRKELGLSFYVQSVTHTWEYPGAMSTQITVTRGQPNRAGKILSYYAPETFVSSNKQKRIELGRIFKANDVPQNSQLGAGSLFNLKTNIKDLIRKQ